MFAQNWQVYTTANSPIDDNKVSEISVDAQNRVWFGFLSYSVAEAMGQSLSIKDGNTWSQVASHTIGMQFSPSEIIAYPNGDLWMGDGPFLTEWSSGTFNSTSPPNTNYYTTAIDSDAVGNIWIAAFGISKWDGTSFTQYTTTNSGLIDNWVTDIEVDGAGNVWAATSSGLSKFNGTTWTNYTTGNSPLPFNGLNRVISDGSGGVWLSFNGSVGLMHFDGLTTWNLYTSSNSGLPNNYIRDMTLDAGGDVWMCTNAGVAEFTGTLWNVYTTTSSTISDDQGEAIEADGNTIYVYTDDDRLNRFNGTTWVNFPSNAGYVFVRNMSIDYSGNVWINTNQVGVLKFDGSQFTRYSQTNTNFHTSNVNNLNFASNGDLLMGSGYGLGNYNGTSWTVTNSLNAPFNRDDVTYVNEDQNGGYWVIAGGVYHYNGTTWTEYNTSNSPLPSNIIYTMEVDINGNVWIGTNSGLAKFNGTTWTIYTTTNSNLGANTITKLHADENGDLWLANNSFFTPLFQRLSGITFTNYTIPSGISINDIHNSNAAGLWIAGVPGVWKYNGSSWTNFTRFNSGLPGDTVLVATHDTLGNMWFGTHFGAARYGSNLVVALGNDTTICPGDSIYLDAGTGFATYLWDDLSTSQGRWVYGPGTYFVDVQDGNGFASSDTVVIISGSGGPFTINLGNDTTLCGPASLTLDAGLIPLANYLWNTNQTTQSITVSTTGWYSVFAIDGCGNVGWDSIYVNISLPIPIQIFDSGVVGLPILPQDTIFCEDTLYAAISLPPGCVGCSVQWNTGSTNLGIEISSSGSYSVVLNDGNGCYSHDTVNVIADTACVWPGDANDDLIANNVDVLSVGLAFGNIGPSRVAPYNDNNWYAHPVANWSQSFINGVNHKHADCDGNGIVQQVDVNVINQNYGLTHNKTTAGVGGPNDPALYFYQLQDSAEAGDTLNIIVGLGRDTLTADSVYGIAFTFHYDPTLIDSNSVMVDYSNSWLGTPNTDLIYLDKDFYGAGKAEIGISRSNLQNRSGFGQIASISVVVQDDVAGKELIFENLSMSFSTVTLISRAEQILPVNLDTGNVVIYQTVDSRDESSLLSEVNMFPNPAQNFVQLESPHTPIQSIEILNIQGMKCWEVQDIRTHQYRINTKLLTPGVYFVRISDGRALETKKLVITR